MLVLPVDNLLVILSIIINKVIVMPVLIAKLPQGDSKPNKGVTTLPTDRPMATANIILNIIE